MKFTVFGLLCFVAFAAATPLFEECDEKVTSFFDKESCIHVQCYSFKNETVTVSKMSANSCPFAKCESGEYKGETEMNLTKVYPDCCAQAICE